MKIYEFDVEEDGRHKALFRKTEDEAVQLRRDLDRQGVDYTYITRSSLYDAITKMSEWNDDSISDGEMLDYVVDIIKMLDI